MIFAPRSSTGLLYSASSINFSASTPYTAFSHFNTTWKVCVRTGIDELIHVMRKKPLVRLRVSIQGEADAGVATQAQYLAESETRLTAEIDFLASLGLDVSKVRNIEVLIRSGAGTSIPTTAVSNSGGDALFTSVAHGMTTGEWVIVSSSTDYDGIFYVEVLTANTFKIRTGAAAGFVAFVAIRAPTVKRFGAVDSAKLQHVDRNTETRIAGQHYIDASAFSSNDGTHYNFVGSKAIGDAINTIATTYQSE
jgi:hypothetical protein